MEKIIIATEKKYSKEFLVWISHIKKILFDKNYTVEILWIEKKDFEDREKLKNKILNKKPFVVFNLFEGFLDDPLKEVDFATILEELKIPFTGNSSLVLDICLNKEKAKNLLKEKGLNVPKGIYIKELGDISLDGLNFPLFVKPCFRDASEGIDEDSLVNNNEELYRVLEKKIEKFPHGFLIEEFIGGREFSVGFLGFFPYELLGVSVLDYSLFKNLVPFLTYKAKWNKSSLEYKTLTPSLYTTDDDLRRKIIDIAQNAAKVIGCKGYFRVDLREKEEDIYVIEVNPNPDITLESGFVRQAFSRGYKYEDLISKIISLV
ncbi:MAG: ATP-grasp domain-containing protein [Candidatus Aenigmatarchaeota archaeon]